MPTSSGSIHELTARQYGTYTPRRPMDVYSTVVGRLSDSTAYLRQAMFSTTPHQYDGSVTQHFQKMREFAAGLKDPIERDRALKEFYFIRARTIDNPRLPADFLNDIQSYSLRKYLTEIEGLPYIHESAKVFHDVTYETHVRPFRYDPTRPYDMSCDWGLHRPAYHWYQTGADGFTYIFREYVPESVDIPVQMRELKRLCRELGQDPEVAAVDRSDYVGEGKDPHSLFKQTFPRTRTVWNHTKAEQSREASVDAIRSLLSPLDGTPKLYVAAHLCGQDAEERGIWKSLLNIPWEWDSVNRCATDKYEKEQWYEHSIDSLSFWAKQIGVDRRKAYDMRQVSYGVNSSRDELLASLLGGR